MSEKEKETVEAEVVDEKTEPKKENAFKKFWNKTKASVNTAMLDSKIEMKFKEDNLTFTLYEKDEMFSTGLNGLYLGEDIVVLGKKEIPAYSVIAEDDTDKAYYVLETKEDKVEVTIDDVKYTRDATLIKVDKNVEEVNVIKAGKKYYRYKGK